MTRSGKGPVVAEVLLGVSEVLVGGDNVTVEFWGEVVIDVLGWVVPSGLGGISSDPEFVRLLGFGNFEISEVINDVSVNTEVWNSVVDLVTEWLLLVLVLGAAGGRADWVRLEVNIGFGLDVRHLVSEALLSGIGVSETVLDVLVNSEVWHVVVSRWLCGCSEGGTLPFSVFVLGGFSVNETFSNVVVWAEMWDEVVLWWATWLGEAGGHLVAELSLSSCEVVLGGLDIGIITEMWHEVVGWVTWGRGTGPGVTEGGLGGGSMLLGLLDVMVNTEVWHEIVHWW